MYDFTNFSVYKTRIGLIYDFDTAEGLFAVIKKLLMQSQFFTKKSQSCFWTRNFEAFYVQQKFL